MSATIRALQDLYRDLPYSELEQAYQIAQANLADAKARTRAGIALKGELPEARADFYAVRGLIHQLSHNGAA